MFKQKCITLIQCDQACYFQSETDEGLKINSPVLNKGGLYVIKITVSTDVGHLLKFKKTN